VVFRSEYLYVCETAVLGESAERVRASSRAAPQWKWCGYPAAGQCSWPSQVPPKSAPCCGAGAGGAAGTSGQCSCPSQVPPKSLLAGGTPGTVGQCSCPSQVPPKSVFGGGVPGAGVPGVGAGVGEADVAGVAEPEDAGAPGLGVGVGVRVDETTDEVVVLVTVTGALVPPEHPAANSATRQRQR
jgi:hypothetical protein